MKFKYSDIVRPAIKLVCAFNGVPVVRPWQEAHVALWKADVGLVVPAAWYRHGLGGRPDSYFLRQRKVGAKLQDLLFATHVYRHAPTAEEDLPGKSPGSKGITRNALLQRRSRLGRAAIWPSGHDPIIEVPAPDRDGRARTGYMLADGVTSVVVLGVDGTKTQFPWSLILVPPGAPAGAVFTLGAHSGKPGHGPGAAKFLPPPKVGS